MRVIRWLLDPAELDRLGLDVAIPILGHMPCDKAAYHKGLAALDRALAALDAHLCGRTFLVSSCWRQESFWHAFFGWNAVPSLTGGA